MSESTTSKDLWARVFRVSDFPTEGLYLYMGEDQPTAGPFTIEQIREAFQKGEIHRSTFLWFEGLANWITVGDVPEIDRRKPVEAPPGPTESAGDDFYVYASDGVIRKSLEEIRELIKSYVIRRNDLVYSEEHQDWLRVDQHDVIKEFFPSPRVPERAIGDERPVSPTNDNVISLTNRVSNPQASHTQEPTDEVQVSFEPSPQPVPTYLVVLRGFSVASAAILMVALLWLTFSANPNTRQIPTEVTYEEIRNNVDSVGGDWSESLVDEWDQLEMPPALRKYFGKAGRRKLLLKWVGGLPENARADFLENLNVVISKARAENKNGVGKAVKEYLTLKRQKLSEKHWYAHINKLEKWVFISLTLNLLAVSGLFIILSTILQTNLSRRVSPRD